MKIPKTRAGQAPLISVVNSMINGAIKLGAKTLNIKRELEGIQAYITFGSGKENEEVEGVPARLGPAIIVRLKIMAKVSIAEHRALQTALFKFRHRNKTKKIVLACGQTSLGGEEVLLVF